MWRREWISRISPSAERNVSTLSSVFDQSSTTTATGTGLLEDGAGLPSLPDLLDELNNDVDLNSLEQLTQSLLQDIARDLENAVEKTDSQESINVGQNGQGTSPEMVGPPPTNLESNGSRCEVLKCDQEKLQEEISEYLLLHHDYCAKKPKQTPLKTKYKKIRPKINHIPKIIIKPEQMMEIENNNSAIKYEFSDATNSIGMSINNTEEKSCKLHLNEENIDAENSLLISLSNNLLSPSRSPISDYGYESLDSPSSLPEDIFDDRVSELFPSLI